MNELDTKHLLLEYEVNSSWLAQRIGWAWGQELAAKYFAWKVHRKYERMIKARRIKGALRQLGLLDGE